jgi:hypothetical protein
MLLSFFIDAGFYYYNDNNNDYNDNNNDYNNDYNNKKFIYYCSM